MLSITEDFEILETQMCRRCRVEKLTNEFHKDNYRATGLSIYCKPCSNIKRNEHRERKKNNNLTFQRHGLKKGTEEYRIHTENRRLKTNYGMSIEQYNDMFNSQGGCCAICKTHVSELTRGLHVDHSHKTNEVRGLLCMNCNTSLGLLKENIPSLEEAIKYLTKNKIISL